MVSNAFAMQAMLPMQLLLFDHWYKNERSVQRCVLIIVLLFLYSQSLIPVCYKLYLTNNNGGVADSCWVMLDMAVHSTIYFCGLLWLVALVVEARRVKTVTIEEDEQAEQFASVL